MCLVYSDTLLLLTASGEIVSINHKLLDPGKLTFPHKMTVDILNGEIVCV
jgi:hypothetical protein